jgi:hypothetical protein
MKFKTFNATVVGGKRSKDSTISFSSKTGVFRFNNAAACLLTLNEGDQVEFAQDEEKTTSWYLAKTKENGFEVRNKKGLVFNNSKMAAHLISSLPGLDEATNFRIKIIEPPVHLEGKSYYAVEVSKAYEDK